MNREWMEEHATPCPVCAVQVEKSVGCNHMQCEFAIARAGTGADEEGRFEMQYPLLLSMWGETASYGAVSPPSLPSRRGLTNGRRYIHFSAIGTPCCASSLSRSCLGQRLCFAQTTSCSTLRRGRSLRWRIGSPISLARTHEPCRPLRTCIPILISGKHCFESRELSLRSSSRQQGLARRSRTRAFSIPASHRVPLSQPLMCSTKPKSRLRSS